MENKYLAFEYVLLKLEEWFYENNPDTTSNDLSILKSLKLLFFVSAVNSNKNSTSTLLDYPFDNFVAMPYGHVESDVYDALKRKLLENSTVDISSCTITNKENILGLDDSLKSKIDNSILKLKLINKSIINFSSFELVELSHSWFSWRKNYNEALKNNIFSFKINIEDIKSEEKFYQI